MHLKLSIISQSLELVYVMHDIMVCQMTIQATVIISIYMFSILSAM